MSDRPADRPAHIITPDEVDAWLADSAVKVVTVHRTDPDSARDIMEHGVDLTKGDRDAAWGWGFYSSTIGAAQYGEAEVRVAMRLTHPLVLPDTVRGAEIVDDLMARTGTDDLRLAVLDAGYDGIVLHFGATEMWVVAYRDDQVKVVEEAPRG
jgi:hypothetical protein